MPNKFMSISESELQALRNVDFYRNLLLETATHLGPEVYISDDGSVQEDPLLLKIPELVREMAGRDIVRQTRIAELLTGWRPANETLTNQQCLDLLNYARQLLTPLLPKKFRLSPFSFQHTEDPFMAAVDSVEQRVSSTLYVHPGEVRLHTARELFKLLWDRVQLAISDCSLMTGAAKVTES